MPSTNRNILFPYDLEEVVPTPEEGLKIFRWFLQPPLGRYDDASHFFNWRTEAF